MQRADGRRAGLGGLSERHPRWWALPFSIFLGVVVAVGYWRNDERQMAMFAVVALSVFGAYLAFSKSEYAVAGTPEGDERQRSISLEASHFGYLAMTLVAVLGFLWEDVYNHVSGEPPGIFTLLCVVSAVSYGLAFSFLKRRR